MKRIAVVFFPQNLYPPQSGLHKRGLEMLAALKETGFDVTLASSTTSASPSWNDASIEGLKKTLVKEVNIYEQRYLDRHFVRLLRNVYQWTGRNPPVNSALHTPPRMREWFARLVQDVSPDVLWMNYAYWDGIINHNRDLPISVIDIIDLLTLNLRMQRELRRRLPNSPIKAHETPDELLNEDFYKNLGLRAETSEFRIYDKYHHTVTLSSKECALIKAKTHKTKVSYIPMAHEAVYLENSYDGPALFPTGPNPFNVQGYLYFAEKVLPQVRRFAPAFSLQVTGYVCSQVSPTEGVLLSGYIPDLATAYAHAPFVICPIFGGTGQQIKIVEAMSHGVPVIALQAAAESSPIRHGVNGLVANNAEEFAGYVVQLWRDRDMCSRLGKAARETIAAELGRTHLIERLSSVLG